MKKWVFILVAALLMNTIFSQIPNTLEKSAANKEIVYRLVAGQFANQSAAHQLQNAILAQGVAAYVVSVADTNKAIWAQVQIGDYSSADQARSQRSYISQKLGLPAAMPVVTAPGLQNRKK